LKQCGDDLTRANIMKQAASLKSVQLPMVIDGIKANTSESDFYPLQSLKMHRFKGETWEPFGDVISGEATN
jgi:branched-chain amino acid transport system substrate-binding protein